MANEASLNISLTINDQAGFQWRSFPTAYRADVAGKKGPTPGAVTARTTGTGVNLSELGTPGFCHLENLDRTNFVTVGVYDGAPFLPLLELGPGEFTVGKRSPHPTEESQGPGQGPYPAATQ